MKRVISCSRRTDIPAFYTNWLINRIRDGYCHVINPYGSQVYYVSLKPEDCLAFVFWTRNPNPLLNHLSEFDIRGYKYYFHFTLIKYPELLESNTPDFNKSIDNFKKLSDMIGPNNVRWRYDPIIISSITNYDYHIENFSSIAKQLQSYTNHCTFSFVDFYGKTLRNLNRISVSSNLIFLNISLSRKISLIKNLNEIGKDYGISLYSCCENDLLIDDIRKSQCIDPVLLLSLTNDDSINLKLEPTRKDCGCVSSIDIGAYDTCLFGCSYCYATNSRSAAIKRYKTHDQSDTTLWRPERMKNFDLDKLAKSIKK